MWNFEPSHGISMFSLNFAESSDKGTDTAYFRPVQAVVEN